MTLGTMNHDADKEDLIQLEPLVHQVGGHSSMYVLDNTTLCKPMIGREYRFYRTLPPEVKKYTPQFRGTLRVVLQEAGEGLTLAALPSQHLPALRHTQDALKPGCLRRISSSSVELESDEEDEQPNAPPTPPNSACSAAPHTRARDKSYTNLSHPDSHNPWLEQCQQTTLHKLKQKSDSSNVVECIMLENLTFKFRYPCVLDLKMGTRQYGDDAPESKRKSQTAKAANTTTISLGVRLAGMQVYNKEENCYISKNKYYGRQLTEDGFKQTLRHFLHNGRRLRHDILEIIISKLDELYTIISKLDSVRFFTSSLLILYDGNDPCHAKVSTREAEQEEVKGQDNARGKGWGEEDEALSARDTWPAKEQAATQNHPAFLREASGTPKHPSYLREATSTQKHSSYLRESASTGGGKAPREQIGRSEGEPPYKAKVRQRHRDCKPRVDIRLIDFAHATHKGMGDSKVYHGPDEGIMLGLNSLVKIFQDIRDKYDH